MGTLYLGELRASFDSPGRGWQVFANSETLTWCRPFKLRGHFQEAVIYVGFHEASALSPEVGLGDSYFYLQRNTCDALHPVWRPSYRQHYERRRLYRAR